MRITAVIPHLFVAPLAQPIADARNIITSRSAVFVEIQTDSGLIGWGESASFAGCGALVAQVVRFFSTALVGTAVDGPDAVYDRLYRMSLHFGRRGLVINALSGIDIALWDIKGKSEGRPIHRMLGAARDAIRFYFNGGYFVPGGDNDAALARSAEATVARGATALKIKIGRSREDDAKRLEIVRRIIGADCDLMVDVNGILEPAEILKLDPILVEQRVRWLEEPVSLRPIEELRSLRAGVRTPVAGYELEQTAQGWHEIIAGKCVDVAQPDAIWSGGIGECRRVAADASDHGVEFVPHNFASIVSLAANAHLAAAAPSGGWLEVDSNDNPFLWPLDRVGAFRLQDGAIVLPDLPGLGIEPNFERIEMFRVPI